MSYWKRSLIWSAVATIAWVWLLLFTDLHISFFQTALLLIAFNCHGHAQRHVGRWDKS